MMFEIGSIYVPNVADELGNQSPLTVIFSDPKLTMFENKSNGVTVRLYPDQYKQFRFSHTKRHMDNFPESTD